MTVYAQLILEAIGNGYRLRVPKDEGDATLVDNYSDFGRPHYGVPQIDETWKRSQIKPPIGPLDRDAVQEVLTCGQLLAITKQQVHQRMGWLQLGLDGNKADFYCFIQ